MSRPSRPHRQVGGLNVADVIGAPVNVVLRTINHANPIQGVTVFTLRCHAPVSPCLGVMFPCCAMRNNQECTSTIGPQVPSYRAERRGTFAPTAKFLHLWEFRSHSPNPGAPGLTYTKPRPSKRHG